MTDEDIIELANLMIEYDWSIRTLSENTLYSRTSIHRALTKKLPYIDDELYIQCRSIMKQHKEEMLRDDRSGKFVKRH